MAAATCKRTALLFVCIVSPACTTMVAADVRVEIATQQAAIGPALTTQPEQRAASQVHFWRGGGKGESTSEVDEDMCACAVTYAVTRVCLSPRSAAAQPAVLHSPQCCTACAACSAAVELALALHVLGRTRNTCRQQSHTKDVHCSASHC